MKEIDGIRKQYERECKQQEIDSNKRIISGFWYFIFMFFFIYALSVVGFFKMDFLTMSITLGLVLILCLLAINLGNFCKLSEPWLKYALLAIICVVSGAVTSILTVHAVFLYILPLLFAIQCRQKAALWFTYVVDIFSMGISSIIGFYFGICDLNILIEGNFTRNHYLNYFYDGLIHLRISENPALIIIIFETIPRALILLIFALMLQHTVIHNTDDAIRIAELTWKKERDIVTGVYNKNIYEEMADGFFPNIKKVSAIYFDLNNLKKTNDQYGHEEGDALIGLLSQCLMQQGDERYKVFRLGGDEFLMTIENPELRETEQAILDVQLRLKESRTPRGLSVTSAVGWSAGDGKDIRRIVKTADANMYANKVAGKEGRGR